MSKQHIYNLTTKWTGNTGTGTSAYKAYERAHEIWKDGKPEILLSSDPSFRGDKTRYNPEELLIASLSSCHMLWYLHLCSEAGVVVTDYIDHATGNMKETEEGSGYFTEVTLYPEVTVLDISMINAANTLHQKAHSFCFIAKSVNFPVRHRPVCRVA